SPLPAFPTRRSSDLPLNLYIRNASREDAEKAVLDYGQCIRDLAVTNIFAGDLLLKNFGVTRHGRVIFYDYDELCAVTDCRFRDVPPAQHEEDELRDRKSTRLNSSHVKISYAVFCLKKKKQDKA